MLEMVKKELLSMVEIGVPNGGKELYSFQV
jgi:hypothetical protein